jgi:hypothetical protein
MKKYLFTCFILALLHCNIYAQGVASQFLNDTISLPRGVKVHYEPTYRTGFIYDRPVVTIDTVALVADGWVPPKKVRRKFKQTTL